MPVVGVFTLIYFLVTEGIKQLPNLFELYIKLPFLVQEIILLIVVFFLLPKIYTFKDWLVERKSQLDEEL